MEQEAPNIIYIGITGHARSGKDTFATALCNILRKKSKRLVWTDGFAGYLKWDIAHLFDTDTSNVDVAKTDPLGRAILQFAGTYLKEKKGLYYLIDRMAECHNECENDICIITDVRFPFEANWIRSKGGYVLRMERPGQDLSDPMYQHESERFIDEIKVDLHIRNDQTTKKLEIEARHAIEYIRERCQARYGHDALLTLRPEAADETSQVENPIDGTTKDGQDMGGTNRS